MYILVSLCCVYSDAANILFLLEMVAVRGSDLLFFPLYRTGAASMRETCSGTVYRLVTS